jgi:hypothetical protein
MLGFKGGRQKENLDHIQYTIVGNFVLTVNVIIFHMLC